MTNDDQWQRRCARGREGKMLHQEAGKKTDQLRWSMQWLFDVKRCYKSCCVFIICKFQTAVEFGSARVQRKQGSHLPDHQSSRVLYVTLITIVWLLPQTLSTKCHIFSCFRDGGKRFDAEFQGSHHQLDKQEIFHMISKWKQRCKMNEMNV